MPNGKELINELQFDKLIKEKDDRTLLEFTARQTLEIKKELGTMNLSVILNSKRSKANRIALIALVAVLIGLGILDTGILHIFGI